MWAVAWIDAFRGALPREGLKNTNNYSEAAIRSVQMHLEDKRGGIAWLIKKLVDSSIQSTNDFLWAKELEENKKELVFGCCGRKILKCSKYTLCRIKKSK